MMWSSPVVRGRFLGVDRTSVFVQGVRDPEAVPWTSVQYVVADPIPVLRDTVRSVSGRTLAGLTADRSIPSARAFALEKGDFSRPVSFDEVTEIRRPFQPRAMWILGLVGLAVDAFVVYSIAEAWSDSWDFGSYEYRSGSTSW
jgi:hypothetical protein